MPRPKPPQPAKAESKNPENSVPPGLPGWKGKALVFVFSLVILAALWAGGVFNKLTLGPNIPLPREALNLSLGLTMDQVLEKYPLLNMGEKIKEHPKMGVAEIMKKYSRQKKQLRSFNNDPLFGIATLTPQTGLSGASSLDLLFYKEQLYFVSAMWEGGDADKIPVGEWAKQFRRWTKTATPGGESLGAEVTLKEWHFNDNQTEMTLRDLNYGGKLQRWQDLRDGANTEAQAAFQKYRLDGSN